MPLVALRTGPGSQVLWYKGNSDPSIDPSPAVGDVIPSDGNGWSFADKQPRIAAPFAVGDSEPDSSVLGLIDDSGNGTINLEFNFIGHMLAALFGDGSDAYAHASGSEFHDWFSGGQPSFGQIQEEWFEGTPQYKRHTFVGVDQINPQFKTNGPATYQVKYVGQGHTLNTADDGDSANLAGTKNPAARKANSFFNGRLYLDGVALGIVTAFDVNMQRNLKNIPVAFNDGEGGGIAAGRFALPVKMTLLFNKTDNLTRYQKAKADGNFTLEVLWADLGGKNLALATRWLRLIGHLVKLPRPAISILGNNELTEIYDGMIEFDITGGGRPAELIGTVKATVAAPIVIVAGTNDVLSVNADGVPMTATIPPASYSDMTTLAAAVPVVTTAHPATAPTAALDSTPTAGSVDDGTHVYAVSFMVSAVETAPSVISNVVTVVDHTTNGKVQLTAIPVGPTGVTARHIYRSKAGTTTPLALVATIADNTTTTYLDNTADSALTTAPVYPLCGSTVDAICGYLRVTSPVVGAASSVQGVTVTHDCLTTLGLDTVAHSGFAPHALFAQLKTGGDRTTAY